MNRRLLSIPALSIGALLCVSAPALADTASDATTSANWAGYAASGSQFSKVSGSWVQPAAKCASGSGDAAFWVGIGGATGQGALEQAGTEANCSDSGSPVYSAWYELVPAGPVTVDLPVKPGDHISTTVGVNGDQVSIALTNETTGQSFNKTLQMDNPDTSSAEWIAEAPSDCQGSAAGQCQTVPLADFGSVAFSNATATGGGQTGTAEQWGAQALQLSPSGGFDVSAQSSTASASAVPSTVSGGSFSVAWQSADSAQAGGGSADPYGYGSGGSSADPYGYGDGGSGYGADPYGYGDGGSSYGVDPYGYGDGGSGYGADPYGYSDGSGDYGYGF